MKNGEYILARQVGAKGYYSKVRLAVETLDTQGFVVDICPECIPDWAVGLQFGIAYGWELFRRSNLNLEGLSVHVLEAEGQPSDTTNLVMAFVSANALWNALNWSPAKPPTLDAKTGCFTFSKY